MGIRKSIAEPQYVQKTSFSVYQNALTSFVRHDMCSPVSCFKCFKLLLSMWTMAFNSQFDLNSCTRGKVSYNCPLETILFILNCVVTLRILEWMTWIEIKSQEQVSIFFPQQKYKEANKTHLKIWIRFNLQMNGTVQLKFIFKTSSNLSGDTEAHTLQS